MMATLLKLAFPLVAALFAATMIGDKTMTPKTAAPQRKLSDLEIAQLCKGAGFSGDALVIAIRCILGESSGNPAATNVNTGAKGKYKNSVDRGIWQFNNVAFPELSEADARDVNVSTAFAFKTWRHIGFKPWKGITDYHRLHSVGGVMVEDRDRIARAAKAAAAVS